MRACVCARAPGHSLLASPALHSTLWVDAVCVRLRACATPVGLSSSKCLQNNCLPPTSAPCCQCGGGGAAMRRSIALAIAALLLAAQGAPQVVLQAPPATSRVVPPHDLYDRLPPLICQV